ncbi:hypothetical protein BCV69DRAFT_299555 [Microstroma glucosiphilum]|uniref:RlpA-like protein double-psi beta-barrel domain-containing protein n=1 Tax=Pseudomicrostroma glucosiphilum TaxID=1684307 RepID=A0A316U6I4_9BASI|nr:hypothetical protein BCV69DRAFT_299555 [Pseudomicrostroma glucosiphilum]PWN20428.1 hypothetical protein BCV69DRAFT_299555 [Pseudomicrostroma glucosiphilum]
MRPTLSLIVGMAVMAAGLASASVDSAVDSPAMEVERSLPVVERAPGMVLQKRRTTKATWYGGGQLDNPACGGATPTDNSMVAAVSENGPFQCGDHIKLSKGGKSVTVKVVDKCAGCGAHHIDLTKGAFKKLGPLSEGVIHHITYST